MENLTDEEQRYLKAFQGNYPLGSFESLIVSAFKIADLANQKALALAFPEIARGYKLWLSGDYN